MQTAHPASSSAPEPSEALASCLARARAEGEGAGIHAVAFSGGVDSSLVAWLVHRIHGDRAVACLGLSPSVSAEQRGQARTVASVIGIRLVEVETDEGTSPGYVANAGEACFYCKTSLYTTLERLSEALAARLGTAAFRLYNGTNHDDLSDPTRVGLRAARAHGVRSPIDHLPKAGVRQVAREVGLPNWDFAAAPCLRSRLQLGVAATPERLARVEAAERIVRERLGLGAVDALRVRTLRDDVAMIEVEPTREDAARDTLPALRAALLSLGFSAVDLRPFRSGALSRPAPAS